MRFLSLLLCIVTLSSPSLATIEKRPYSELIQIDSDSPQFWQAFVELQKHHYSHQMWDRFFAYALFYRAHLEHDLSRGVRDTPVIKRLISLEALALAKHCYFKEAYSFMDAFEQGKLDEEIEATRTHVQLQEQLASLYTAKKDGTRPRAWFNKKLLWKVPNDVVLKLDNPKNLRRVVPSQCESRGDSK